MEIILLLGNIMIQRGLWEAQDAHDVPAVVSGIIGMVSFGLSICLNSICNTAKEERTAFAPRRFLINLLLLASSVNIWRGLWNIQNEFEIPWLHSTVAGGLIVLLGMVLEQCSAAQEAALADELNHYGENRQDPEADSVVIVSAENLDGGDHKDVARLCPSNVEDRNSVAEYLSRIRNR